MPTPVTPAPPTNYQAVQDGASAAQAAALKLLETSKIDNSTAPVEVGDVEPKEVVKVDPDEEAPGEETTPEEEKKEEPKVEAKKEEGLPDPLKKSFDRLAAEKKELRDQQAALKAESSKYEKYRLLEAAVQRGDALGVLAAHGMGYKHVVQQISSGKAPAESAEAEEETETPGSAFDKRIAALEATIQKERFERGGEKLLGKMQEVIKNAAAKYPNIAADPDLVADARQYLYDFTRQTGSPPGEDINESMQMALEAVEQREEKLAEKYLKRKGLTPGKPAADTQPAVSKSAVEQPASELGSSRKTLTNSHASSPQAAGSTRPKTVAELHAEALKLLEAQG